MSDNKNTRAQLYWNTLLRIPGQMINFVISILVARLLEPRDFGIMGIAMMLIGYTNMFTNFGFSDAIIQRGISDKKILNSIFTFNLAVSTLLAIVFFLSAGLIADFFNTPECGSAIRVLSLVFIITAFPVIPGAILRKNMDFKILVFVDFIQSILTSMITLFMAWKGFGYWALVYGQIIPITLVSIILCIKMRFVPILYYSHSLMKSIYNFGGWNFLRVQLLFISQHVDRFVVGKWLGPVQLGFYDKAITLGATPYNTLIMNINSVMFSSFSIEKENVTQLRESFRKSLALLSFINFPLYLGLIAIAPHFVYSLLGDKWAPMVVPFQIVLAGFIFRSFMGLVTSLNVSVGRYKDHTVRSLLALLFFTALCIMFRNQDIKIISLCFMVFCIVEIVLFIDLSRRAIKVNLSDILWPMLPGLTSSLIMFLVTIASSYFIFSTYSILNMFLIMFIGVITYILCILLNPSSLAKEFKSNLLKDSRKFLQR
jgi:O-antigen/teichoic acid export membrane protein